MQVFVYVPLLQETVMYALSSSDAHRVLRLAGAGSGGTGTGAVHSLQGGLPDDEVLFKKRVRDTRALEAVASSARLSIS